MKSKVIDLTKVSKAVQALRDMGAAAINGMKLPDPKNAKRPYKPIEPAPPATTTQIGKAEKALGVQFPPSYRHFLGLHNGWKEVDLGSDLLDVESLVTFHQTKAAKALTPILEEIERETSDGLIVFGKHGSGRKMSMFIFDTSKLDAFGEWSVIEYDAEDGMLDAYPNFLAFLEDTIDTLKMMIPKTGK